MTRRPAFGEAPTGVERELLGRRVGLDAVLGEVRALHARHELLGVEAVVVGLLGPRVAHERVVVLVLARDAELGREAVRAVAHDLAWK